jgi:hypothetical protein
MARVTPAQRHFARKMAAKAAESRAMPAGEDGRAGAAPATEYELKLAELGADLKALKNIQARDAKQVLKRELIGKYDAWVAGVLDARAGGAPAVRDDVLLYMMMWALDIEDYDRALETVSHVLENDLALPERFSRTAPTLIAEVSADNALAHLSQGEDCNLDWLVFVRDETADRDMLDPVRAKLHKAIGLALGRKAEAMETGDNGPAGGKAAALSAAIAALKEAMRLNSAVGVKKETDRLERLLKAAQPHPEGAQP